ncbi:MAG: zinc-dependent metalloprotease, partial [Bdellovibrionota bacterium]
FAAKETSDFDQVGFFEVPPTLETTSGRSSVKISKWDASKPITYSVSANTPAEYVDAVKDGILYWNKAFGKEIVKADVAPKGVTAPDPVHNVVQWVPWDRAGFAYADAQMDPRSGEIKNAQVYMTSAFTFGSKARMRKLLRSLRATAAGVLSPAVDPEAAKNGDTKALLAQAKAVFGALPTDLADTTDLTSGNLAPAKLNRQEREKLVDSVRQRLVSDHSHVDEATAGQPVGKSIKVGFTKPTRMCDVDMTKQLEATMEAALDANADDATILRISQDYVRLIIAHEIGHTLGMRHNFAGSLASPMTAKERATAFNEYVTKGTKITADKVLSSSVMDYLIFSDDVLAGSLMQNQSAEMKTAMAYDELAIQWAYAEKQLPLKGTPLFCTDSGMYRYLDCMVFDAGAKPIEYAASYRQQAVRDMPKTLVETYLSAKAPANALDAIALEKVSVDANAVALNIALDLYSQMLWLDEDYGRSLTVERSFEKVSYFNRDEVLAKRYDWVKTQVQDAGGVDSVFLSTYPICSASNVMQSSACAGYGAKITEQMGELDAYLAR